MNDIRQSLETLKTSVQYAKGVGPVLAKILDKLEIRSFEDLIYHIPFRYLDRRTLSQITSLQPGKDRVVMGSVYDANEIFLGRSRRRIFEVVLFDGTGYLTGKWFHYSKRFFQDRFKKGEKFLFFGEVTEFRGERQMVHPEVQKVQDIFDEEELHKYTGLIPVYSSTEGLYQKSIRRIIAQLLNELQGKLVEFLPVQIQKNANLPSLADALAKIHHPNGEENIESWNFQKTIYHRRLIFEEFFFLQLGLGHRRLKGNQKKGFTHVLRFELRDHLLKTLPFELTSGQKRALEEITEDMCSAKIMSRLLQGDVGSGKTIVCMLAALLAIENGKQVAIMAPTEILAEQHYKNFTKLLAKLKVEVQLLTSSIKGKGREEILEKIKSKKPIIVIGTHALIEEEVGFQNLSLVIIDEQHRFGVKQRMQLMQKGVQPDVLVMTATPIPRSLAMTLYGDLDLSLMMEMPQGRQPIVTRIMMEKDRPKLYEFIKKKVNEGQQIYFVFPLIEESEKLALKDATRAHKILCQLFPDYKIGLLHGKMKAQEKEKVMQAYSQGEIHILVSTTVIEVGIDIPNSTVMVIEHAERFGLSQLHQLRGRVGRGAHKSYCILATDYRQSNIAKERLKVMENSCDGFQIAEEDLKIRGPGDFLGTRQSGMPQLRIGNLITDLKILEEAKGYATQLLERDPDLKEPEHQMLRLVLEHRWKGRLSLGQVG